MILRKLEDVEKLLNFHPLQVITFKNELNSLSFPGLVILVQYPPCLVRYTFWSRLMNNTKIRYEGSSNTYFAAPVILIQSVCCCKCFTPLVQQIRNTKIPSSKNSRMKCLMMDLTWLMIIISPFLPKATKNTTGCKVPKNKLRWRWCCTFYFLQSSDASLKQTAG